MNVHYLTDDQVDATLDAELRTLLSTSFTGAHNDRFRHQRFYHEMPMHRLMVRDGEGQLIAHVAMHDKIIGSDAGDIRIAGVAEVCVAKPHRGQGLVRHMLVVAHEWATGHKISFGALIGNPKVYGSSGYLSTTNPIRRFAPDTGEWLVNPMASFLIKPLGQAVWPSGDIELRGPTF